MMKGKISVKTIIVIVILILVGVLGVLGVGTARTYLSGAAGGAEPKGVVSNPAEDGKSAVITWTTDKEAQSIVQYGTSPAALLLSVPEKESTTSHSVTLSSLKPGQNYYFRVKVGEEVFDNSGIPYSFKTGSSVAPTMTPAPTATLAPVVESGSCNRTTDYNKDGTINTADYIGCVRGGGGTMAPATSTSATTCRDDVDYDGNGIINSLDKSKCLQNSQ